MMTVRRDDTAETKSPSVTVGITLTVTVTVGIGSVVITINPSLGHLTMHHPFHSLVRRPPSQVSSLSRHTRRDLPICNQLLLARGQAMVNVRMVSNSRLDSRTSGKEQSYRSGSDKEYPRGKSMLHSIKIIPGHNNESISSLS